MDRSDLELVLAVRLHGSLVKAARALQLAPPVVTKRLCALESHLGVRLFQRTTRRVSPTTEGHALCDRAAELLNSFVALEDELRERQSEPSGLLRIACSFGFGRLWLGPLLAEFQARYPAVRVDLQLSEQLPDLANEGFDAAIWLWHPPDHIAAEWISRKLATNQRVLVAAPAYLAAHGTPQRPEDLASHACLMVRENGGETGHGQRFDHWRLSQTGQARALHMAVQGPLSSNSGEMVRDWCLAGHGIAWRSTWEVETEINSGQLVPVLEEFAAPPNGIYAVFSQRKHLPLRLRLWIDFLKDHYGHANYWSAAA